MQIRRFTHKIAAAIVLIVTTALVIGCTKETNVDSSDELIGTWNLIHSHEYPVADGVEIDPHEECDLWYPGIKTDDYDEEGEDEIYANATSTIIFSEDGTVNVVETFGDYVYRDKGSWEVVDGYLFMSIDANLIYARSSRAFSMKKSGKKLTLTSHYEGFSNKWVTEFVLSK